MELFVIIIMAQAPEKKILAKVILLGNMGVGKTTLLNKYVDGPNATNQPTTTIGTDFRKKDLKIGLMNITL
jgi:GTPase SAR1 family protein